MIYELTIRMNGQRKLFQVFEPVDGGTAVMVTDRGNVAVPESIVHKLGKLVKALDDLAAGNGGEISIPPTSGLPRIEPLTTVLLPAPKAVGDVEIAKSMLKHDIRESLRIIDEMTPEEKRECSKELSKGFSEEMKRVNQTVGWTEEMP